MLRLCVYLSSLLALAVFCSIATNCGNSYGSGGNGTGPYNVVGDWQANFSPGIAATTSGYGAIDSAGLGAFFDTSGNIVQMPTITGAASFSGNVTAYAVNGTFFSGGSVQETDSGQGKVYSTSSITGTFTGTSTGSFSLVPFSPMSGAVAMPSGTMNGKLIGFSDTLQLTFASDGTISGADYASPQSPGCTVSGKLTRQGTSDVFDIAYSETAGPCTANSETGIGFESSSDYFNVNGGANTTYFYGILLTSNSQQVRPYVFVVHE